jgi:hypothetical protein
MGQIIVEMQAMKRSVMDQFRFDLTEEQRRLCDWIARQARTGSRRIRYDEARAALDVHDEQLTRMLRDVRERLDEIHEMVEAPIVNTWSPYFEVPGQARYIWASYCRAEQETEQPPLEGWLPRSVAVSQ